MSLVFGRSVARRRVAAPRSVVECGCGREHEVHERHDDREPTDVGGSQRRQHRAQEAGAQEEDRSPVHQNTCSRPYAAAATMAAPGMVKTHAQTTRPATPHRTADKRWLAPTPTMPPVIVCVVETGMPWAEVKNNMAAAADSAQTPPTGLMRVSLVPIVFTMRHPPVSVPSAMAVCAESTTHSGTSEFLPTSPVAMSRARITPIVFCASLAPWPRLYAPADTSCMCRKPRLSFGTFWYRWVLQRTPIISTNEAASPASGASTMNTAIVRIPSQTNTPKPA